MDDVFKTRHTLLKRVQVNYDEQSWDEFVHYYYEFIYLICRRMDISHHDSDEIVQLVLVKLWKKLPEVDCSDFRRFRSWLCTITGCTAKDFIRSRISRYNNERQAGTEASEWSFTQPQIETIAEEEWENFILKQAMKNVQQNFSPQVMGVFDALHDGLTLNEVADKFDIPVNTVSVYKRRVIAAMCSEIRRLERELR